MEIPGVELDMECVGVVLKLKLYGNTRSRTGRGESERRRLRQSLQRREAAGCDSLPEFISESDNILEEVDLYLY